MIRALLLLLLSVVCCFAQADRKRAPGLQSITVTNISVSAGPSQTIPGPHAIAAISATVTSSSDTNLIYTTWRISDGPGSATFSNVSGLTNLITFLENGRYIVATKSQIGNYASEFSFPIFIVDQNITNFPPSIVILSPENGNEFTSPIDVPIIVDAQDKDGSIASVVYLNGNTPIATNTVAPYGITLFNATVGTYVIAALSTDNVGATNLSRPVSFDVRPLPPPPSPPLVNITIPTNGAVFLAPSTFLFTATATDDGSITSVIFVDNNVTNAIDTVAPYSVSRTPPIGIHNLKAIATDNLGLQSIATAIITIINNTNILPTITLTGPANGATFTAPATINLTASASDSDGTIVDTRFYVNGVRVGTDAIVPYNFLQSNVPVGTYSIYVEAVDDKMGLSTSATNTIVVNPAPGIPPTITLTSPLDGAMFASGDAIIFSANSIDPDGTVTNVVWYDVTFDQPDPEFPPVLGTSTLITNDTIAPYSRTLILAVGSHIIQAIAWDNGGLSTTSTPPVFISVNPALPPVVQLTSPTNGSSFAEGTNIAMTATASDPDSAVTNVVFMQFQPDVFLAQDTNAPYTGTWTNAPAGDFSVVAKAYSAGLATISPVVNLHIVPSVPQNVFVDAGPFLTNQISAYQSYFDSEYTANKTSFDNMAANADGPTMYNMQFVIDATCSAYEGSHLTNYIDRALTWCMTCASKATVVDSMGKSNWHGIWASPYSPTPIAYQLEDFQGASSMSRTARIVMSNPDLYAVFGNRAMAIYNFVRDHIVNKSLVSRNEYSNYLTWSTDPTSSTSDKPSILFRLLMDLKTMSGILLNNDNQTYGWSTKAAQLAEGIKSYNGAETRFIPWHNVAGTPVAGSLIWSHGKNWQGYDDIDTSHANRLPVAVIQGFENGQTFSLTEINGLAKLLMGVLWDGSSTSPQVRNFIDGDNSDFLNRPAWNNGKIYDGWIWLGGYDTNVLQLATWTLKAIRDGVINPSLSYDNSSYGRSSLAGHIMKCTTQRMLPAYATLNGVINGTGMTGTNWTHVSGPSGYTIVKPTSKITTVLFNTNAVGSHVFRLTVPNSGPTVSDDVGVVVLAAPNFGDIGGIGIPSQPPPAGGTNIFVKRYIFYRGNLATTAQRDRLLAVMQRGAAAGYNGICLEESGCIKSLTPDANCIANLNTIKTTANSLGMVIIPEEFSMFSVTPTCPIDAREAFPVTNSKFVRSGATALPAEDPSPILNNGGFEVFTGNSPANWAVTSPGSVSFVDTVTKHGGTAALRFMPNGGTASCVQNITVIPFRAYRITCYVKTSGVSDPTRIKFNVVGNIRPLIWYNRDSGIGTSYPGANQDWTFEFNDFNSLENTSISFGCVATGTSGTVWFDDMTLDEVGLYSAIRRTSLPITVKSFDLTKTFTEGTDYVVGDQVLTMPGSSTIPAGAALKVSWYQLGNMAENQPGANFCHPEVLAVMTTNANLVASRLGTMPGFFYRFNEIRVANWDPACGGITMAGYLKDKVLVACNNIVRGINPGAQLYLWDDMYSPYHNAISQYVMDFGTLIPSWSGMDTNIVIMEWNSPSMANELKFWAGLDPAYPKPANPLIIAGYYESTSNVSSWLSALATAEQAGARNVIGFMYTTWGGGSDGGTGNYTDLEAVAQLCKNAGRWTNSPAFP